MNNDKQARPLTTAEKIAEELFRTIEREKRLVKGDFVEAIEKVLRTTLPQPGTIPYPVVPMQPPPAINPIWEDYWKRYVSTSGGTITNKTMTFPAFWQGDGVVGD